MSVTMPIGPGLFARRRLALAALLLVLLALLAPAGSVRAEVIEFDPETDPVPEILAPEDRALLEQARDAGLVYMLTDPSPGMRYVMAYVDGEMGFVDLRTGLMAPLAADDVPGSPVLWYQWLDEQTVGTIHVEVTQADPDAPPVLVYYRVTIDASDGSASYAAFDAEALGGQIVDAAPGMATFLVLELPTGAPAARTVEIGPTFEAAGEDIPAGVPGRVGAAPLGPVELQQAEFTLALVDADGSDRRELTALPADSGLRDIAWSPDGSRVAITTVTMPGWQSARSRGDDPPVPGTPNLDSINVREALGLVAPEDNPLVAGTRIQVFGVASGETVRTFDNADYLQGTLSGISFAPDGDHALLAIALKSELEERAHPTYAYPSGMEVQLLDADLGLVRTLEGPGMDLLSSGALFLDEDRLLSVTADEVTSRMAVHDIATGAVTDLWDESGPVLQAFGADAAALFTHADVGQPWEIWSGTVPVAGETFAPTRATDFFPAAAEVGDDLLAEPVSWDTSDGATIHGVYVHHVDVPFPPEEPGPLVVWQQGGPGGQMVRDYGSTVESPYSILPHYGLPVLIANASGRTVKSRAFYSALADGTNFGQIDIAQIREGVEALARQGIVHPGRVGITGCSYGGYFTLQSLRTYPDVYRAGNAQCSLVDLTEEFTFGYTPVISYLMGRAPMADPQEYLRDSPYFGAGDIRSRLLLFHGTDDFLPVPLIHNIHDEVAANDVPATFLKVRGEGHGFSRDESQSYAAQVQIRFFLEHLVEADVGPPPSYGATIFLPAVARHAAP